nr:MAG TPA: hypothetical protein [Caudoviricetes sp.]
MIEFPITLTSGGSVCLPGHAFALALGYTKNRGVYRLHVDATGEWEGLAIRCFWHVPDGKAPASSLVVDGYVDVPASVTAQPGNGCITFEGSDGTMTVTSADLRYRVSANSGTEDGTTPEPGTPAWQQLVDAVHTDATAAEQAKTDAQTAAQQAGASAQKAGQALSDTITAKDDALKAIGDKQTSATQAVDTARDKAIKQVEASTKAAQTAASEAAASAGSASQSAQEAAGSLQELKDGIANGDFKGEPGNDGKSPVVTVADIENGHRVSITDKDGTKTIDVLNGQTGKTGATPVLTIGTVSSGDKPSADITGTPENPVLNLRLQPGPQGPAVALDTTLTHEGEAADAKATGDAISAVKARQNILVGTETGNPLSVDDAFPAPLCGLTVYGKSTQGGTPTPDAPVPIVSAGDSGSVAVKVTGKNLLNPSLFQNNKYQSFNAETGYYGIDYSDSYWITGLQPCLPNTTYRFNISVEGGCFYDEKKNVIGILEFEFTVKTPAKCAYYCANFSSVTKPYGTPVIATVSEPATYSPYREQLLTLPTPNGLPGIPVTSGGSYTDSTGQQWVCDEVDLERGVKIQRVNAVDVSTCVITGSTNLAATKRLAILLPLKGKDYTAKALCNRLPYFVSFTSDTIHFYVDTNNAQVFIPIGAKNPEEGECILFYILDDPIETPLTPAEIAAYKALTAYSPDTVVQAGDGAGVKLEYQRDVNIVVKNLEDAIASMTTT